MAEDEEIPIKEKTEPFYLAKYFSFTHFHKLLSDCQNLIQIARFGYSDINDSWSMDEQTLSQNRISALKNLFYIIRDQLIKNCEPFMDKSNKKLVDAEQKRIDEIEEMIEDKEPFEESIDQRTQLKTIELTQPYFNDLLKELIDIQTKLKVPLNNEGFLFPKGDEFDIEEWEKRFASGE